MKLLFVVALQLVASAQVARADFEPALMEFLDGSVRSWSSDPVLVAAIVSANAERAGLDQAAIDSLDISWRAEVGQAETPTITPVLDNAAADFLRKALDSSGGKITEIFIVDAKGLNVAVTAATSDMWQGDEDKYARTYLVGPEGVFIDDVELDESTQTYQGQISLSIVDPATQAVIGAMTIGVNAEMLM